MHSVRWPDRQGAGQAVGLQSPSVGFSLIVGAGETLFIPPLAFICVLVTCFPHLLPNTGTHGWIMAGARQSRLLNSGVITRL